LGGFVRNLWILIVCLVAVLLLNPVYAKDNPAALKVVRVGGDQNFPPFEFLDSGKVPSGYNVELTNAIAEVMGFKVEYRLGKWSQVKEWLDKGEIDIIQGMAFSPERSGKYAFSLPHSETWRCFFVKKNSRFRAVKDLTEASIVLQEGDIAIEYLDENHFAGKRLTVPSQEDALLLVAQGKFDAAAVTYRHGMYLAKERKLSDLKPIDEPFSPRFYCYAVRKSNSLLLNEFNTGISILRENGKFYQIQKDWLKTDSLESFSRRLFIRRLLMVVIPLFAVFLAALIWVWLLRRQISVKSRDLQRELEGRLKYESELNREYKMFVNGPVIVYKLQADPNIVSYISDNIRQFGYDPKELILHSKSFTDIIFSEDRERVLAHFKKDLEEGSEFSAKQYRIITSQGQICWVFDYTLIVRDTEESPWFYGYILDITAQKTLEAELLEAKEKAEAANIAKGHFLSNISHEIRTPLNGILGFIQVLQGTSLSAEQKEYMDLITSSGKTLMKIVNDILDFSKMESGKLDLIVTDFNPRFLIEDIIKTFANLSDKPRVDLRMRIGENLPTIIYGDMMRLRQIFINLMQNALKFTDSGFIEISADVYNQNEDDMRLLFSVKDTGIGIDPMKQRDIFENFMHADPAITKKYGGTGLGLSIVKKLVALMGGFIWVESEPNKGSNFFFILSFKTKAADRPKFEQQLQEPEIESAPLPKLNILLVEDEPINQLVTQKQLEKWNLSVTTASTGKEALAVMQEHEFDCILMDVQMPEMDGITATNIIRQQEKGTDKHIPIVAFTAAAMAGDRERFIASGMDDYIAKPIDIEQLYRILKDIKKTQS
jgi:PAS domain S-box-containing protein